MSWCRSVAGQVINGAYVLTGRERQTDRVLAALALAVVVVDVDGFLQVGRSPRGLIDRVDHEVQHELAVLEGIGLAPGHVLHHQVEQR